MDTSLTRVDQIRRNAEYRRQRLQELRSTNWGLTVDAVRAALSSVKLMGAVLDDCDILLAVIERQTAALEGVKAEYVATVDAIQSSKTAGTFGTVISHLAEAHDIAAAALDAEGEAE